MVRRELMVVWWYGGSCWWCGGMEGVDGGVVVGRELMVVWW